MVKYWIGIFIVCLFQPLHAAEIALQLDRSLVEIDESFTAIFSATASVDDDPDFSPLDKNFRILNRNKSSSIRIINGKMSRESTWSLSLMAKRTGNLTIPAIQFGADSSRSIKIVVNKSAQDSAAKSEALIFMEVDVSPKKVYVQAQVIYTIRIFHAVNFLDASLTELSLDDSDTIVEAIGNNASYDKQINGRLYKVFEKKYAIFPQKSGTIIVAPFVFETRYIGQRRQMKHRRLRSKAVEITVLPKPKTKNGKSAAYWLPTSSLVLSESWGDRPPKFTVGEPITRTFALTAQGLPASQLPNLHTEKLDFAKLYPDQPVLNDDSSDKGLQGTRIDKVALIPTKAGNFTLPEIRVPWWNTNKNKWESLLIKAKSISVFPAAETVQNFSSSSPTKNSANIEPENHDDKLNDKTLNSDLFGFDQRFWFALSVLFLYLWLLTIVAWWYYARKAKKNKPLTQNNKNSASISPIKNRLAVEKGLRLASEPEEIKKLLIKWGISLFSDNPPHSLGELAKRCGGELGNEINHINEIVYSNSDSEWNAENLVALVQHFQLADPLEKRHDKIEPMFYHVSEKL